MQYLPLASANTYAHTDTGIHISKINSKNKKPNAGVHIFNPGTPQGRREVERGRNVWKLKRQRAPSVQSSESNRRPCLSLCPPYAHKAHTCNNNKLKQDKRKPQPSVVARWITRSLGYSGQNQEDNNTDNEGKTEAWAILTNHDRVQRSRLACWLQGLRMEVEAVLGCFVVKSLNYFVVFAFETGSHCVARVGLELTMPASASRTRIKGVCHHKRQRLVAPILGHPSGWKPRKDLTDLINVSTWLKADKLCCAGDGQCCLLSVMNTPVLVTGWAFE